MKKTLRILSLAMVIAMMLSVFTGCALVDNIKDILGGIIPNPNPEPTPDDNTVTVTWYHGAKELKTEKVEKGTTLESWIPEIEGKEFQGWFAEASLTEAFDFTTVIEEDTDIFAAFKSNVHTEDTNEYYFIGAGAGDMAASNWGHKTETLFMEKQEVEGANVYKLTIKMYAGDKFQICYTGGWDGQMGIGYMVGAEYCDGINAYDNTEYTAADKKVAHVLDAEGNVVFTGSDEYNKSYDVWNIWLADGQDGIYTFTFTTYPDSMQYNTLDWELVEKIEPMSETHKMYLIGTFNGWAPDSLADEWLLKANDTKTSYTGVFTFAEAVELKIYNTVNSDWIGYDGDNLALEAGTYAFKYDTETNSFTYEELDYYIVGTFLDEDGNQVNFAVKDGVTPKLELVDGKYVGTLTVTDVSEQYNWIKNDAPDAVMAVKVVYGSSLANDSWYGDGENNFYLTEGTYTVTLDLEAKTVSIVEAEENNGGNGDEGDVTPSEPTKTTYTLESKNFDTFSGGYSNCDTTVVNDFFTMYWKSNSKVEDKDEHTWDDGYTSSRRLSFNGNTKVDSKGIQGALSFTTTGKTTVRVWYIAGADNRSVALYDSTCKTVLQQTDGTEKKDGIYYVEFTAVDAGTYFVGNPDGNNYFYKIEVVVEG